MESYSYGRCVGILMLEKSLDRLVVIGSEGLIHGVRERRMDVRWFNHGVTCGAAV
jgi:hypothetical protein